MRGYRHPNEWNLLPVLCYINCVGRSLTFSWLCWSVELELGRGRVMV